MKKRFISSFVEAKFLIARCLTLLILALLSTNLAWGATGTIKIIRSSFPSGALSYNVTDNWSVTASTGETISGEGDLYSTKDQTTMQSKNSGVSTMYHNTVATPGPITKITLKCASGTTRTYTAYMNKTTAITSTSGGTSKGTIAPTAGNTASLSLDADDGWHYFWLNLAGGSSYLDYIEIEYMVEDGKTLTSIAISGYPDKTTYEAGEEFDPAGLVVTGTYSEGDPEEITTGITWEVTPNPLTAGTTSVSVTATVDNITSETYVVDGLTVTAAQKWAKVTADKTDWSGEYLLVYENNSTAYVWTGIDAANCNVTATIANNQIIKPATAATITVAAMDGGYSILVNGGTNDGKYIYGTSGSNTVNFGTTASANTLAYSDGNVTITSNTSTIMYNSNSGDNRFRYYKSGSSQKAVQLYELVNTDPVITADPTSVTFPEVELDDATDNQDITIVAKNLTENITVAMKDGSAEIFEVTPASLTISEGAFEGNINIAYLAEATGEYSGTIVLTSGETSIEIPVSASVVAHIPVLQSIAVSGTPTKTEYVVGDAFETAGLVVTGTYDVGEPQVITEGIEWGIDPETFETAGTVSVDVMASVGSVTSEVYTVNNITVNEAPKVIDNWNTLFGTSYNGQISGLQGTNDLVLQGTTAFGVTVKVENHASKNGYVKDQDLRLYTMSDGDYTFTVTAPEGKIFKQIVATKAEKVIAVKEKDDKGIISVDATSGDMTWTGKANSLVFVPTATTGFGTMSFVIAEPTPSAVTPSITPSAVEETYWEPITVTLATETEGAAIYYTTNGDAPTTASTLYENPFEVSATTTIKAFAVKDGLDNSEVATKEFKFGPIYANLTALVEAGEPTTIGNTVKVTLTNEQITKFYFYDNTKSGIYLNVPITNGNKDIVIYCKNVPETWVVGGKVSGTLKCTWKKYSNMWELCPNSWNDLTYVAPTTVTIASSGYSSFSSTYAVTIPEGVTAYYATGVEGNKVSMIEVEGGVIPANEGVIIKGVASQEYTFIETVSDKTFNDNKLVAVSERIEGLAPEVTIDNVVYKNYVFTGGQFHPFTSGATVSVGAGKAYLQVEKTSDTNAKLEMSFGDVTGIESLIPTLSKGKGVYNLQGVRVSENYKGIIIVNGKKYMNK